MQFNKMNASRLIEAAARYMIAASLMLAYHTIAAQSKSFAWPEGKQAAISLTFDDGRASQTKEGLDLLNEFNTKATFYVVPSAVEQQLEGWRKVVKTGHEIGNHSLKHPCTGNFAWSRSKALEDYTLEQMKSELSEANQRIQQLLGVTPKSFAYPCGQKFVGRGKETQSYIPVVATLFQSGRGWLDEAQNDPLFCDFAQLTGVESDGKDFEEIMVIINEAKKNHQWLILAGHEMGSDGAQTTRLSMLKKLLAYANDPRNGIWIAPVGTVASYLGDVRK